MNDFCWRTNAYFFLDFLGFLFIPPRGLPARIFTIYNYHLHHIHVSGQIQVLLETFIDVGTSKNRLLNYQFPYF